MICGRVLVLPDCMALMARELWREERVLLLDVSQGQHGLLCAVRRTLPGMPHDRPEGRLFFAGGSIGHAL